MKEATLFSEIEKEKKEEKPYKYYASACYAGHGNWLEPLGFKQTDKLEDSDVIVFGGGADIEPTTYNEEPASSTYASPAREKQERADYREGLKLGKFMVGICRGHQLLCAMAGGKLIQDVSGHGGDHSITTFDKLTVRANSLHHQMINPYDLPAKDYKILAWTTKRISNRYLGARDKSILLPFEFKEIEAIYFPKIKGFGVQYHPEMMFRSELHRPVVEWTQNTFMKFFNDQL